MKTKQGDPFAALADPTRRAVLLALREEGTLPAGRIAARFPEMSRAAVSKHLKVLRAAELVRARPVGREWHYSLAPEPLLEIFEQWIAPFLPGWEAGLLELKRRVEEGRPPQERGYRGKDGTVSGPATGEPAGDRVGVEGHEGYLTTAVFSADGRRVFSADATGGDVWVWDVATAEALARWRWHDGPVMELRRTGHGRIVSASLDGTIGVWDAEDGRPMRRFTGHDSGVHGLDVAGYLVASGGFDGTVRLWDARRGEALSRIEAHDDTVTAVAILSDLSGRSPMRVASGSRDHTIRVWDAERGQRLAVLEGHGFWVTKLAALPDGRRLVSAGEDGACLLWDIDRGEATSLGRIEEPIWGMALAPDGAFAITGSQVLRHDIGPDGASGEARSLPGAEADRAIAISPGGRLAALGSGSAISVYDLEREEVVRRGAGVGEGALAAAVSEDGARVATGHQDGSVVLRGPGEERRALDGGHAFMAYSLCRAGAGRFATGGFDGVVQVRDFEGGTPIRTFRHRGFGAFPGFVFSVSASLDGRRVLAAGGDTWTLWDVETGDEVAHAAPLGSGDHSFADLTADGERIVSAGEDAVVRCWRPDGALSAEVAHDAGQVSALRLLPDERRVALGDARGRVWLVDLHGGGCERLHAEHEDWIRAVHVTPDGRYVVSVSQNFICRAYDLVERRLLSLDGLRHPIPTVAVDTSGAIVAVSARGEILRMSPPR